MCPCPTRRTWRNSQPRTRTMWRRRCATCATRTSRGTPTDMPTRVVMAQLSPTMEEGKLIEWKVAEGDAVAQGDVVAEIETDKANMDVEALGGGVLRKIVVQAGATVPVGALIGVIAEPDEAIDDLLAEAEAAGGDGPAEGPAEESAALAVAPEPATSAEVAADAGAAAAPAPEGMAAATPGDSAAPAGGRIKASPVARRMAAESGIALAGLAGSGPGGRIVKADVEAALARGVPGVAPVPTPAVPTTP
ncbi:MAG: hypothetical protein F4Z72_10585, partial [Gemmatimonadales bacterium]|nr:hypothetical protein [Candidatus Palauibacter irciniicola]